jgi:hypothetical protein
VAFAAGAEFYLDTDTMLLYQRTDPDQPDVWEEVADMSGSGGAPPGTLPAPGAPVLTLADDDVVIQPDGTVVTSLIATWTAPTPAADRYEVQVGRDAGFADVSSYTASGLTTRITPVAPYVPLWVRVRGMGQYDTPAPWSNVLTLTPGGDPFAPEVPIDLVAVGGFKLVALSWPRAVVADLGRYGVRWTTDLAGAPNPDQWVNAVTLSNYFIIQDLNIGEPTAAPVIPPTKYWFEVRAVDTSNRTRTSASDATPVDVDTPAGKEAGWSVAVAMSPKAVGVADLAVDTLVANMITTGEISADQIVSGTLTVGKTGVMPSIEVVNASGNLLGRWDEDGILLIDPNARGRAIWMAAGEMRTTNAFNEALPVTGQLAGTWTNSVTAEGINATNITFGINPGGHNALPNSGFELTPFTQLTTWKWPTNAAWNTAIAASSVNANTAGASLQLTTATY